MVPSWLPSQAAFPLFTALLLTTTAVGCQSGEHRALLQSIRPLTSDEFGNHVGWGNGSADCCRWEGVARGLHGRVVSLSLFQAGIRGVLDAALFAPFTELEEVDLSFNDITSFASPPSFSGRRGLEKLETLWMPGNRMTDEGIAALVNSNNLTTLSELDLRGNKLLSTNWVSNLTFLKAVDLSKNSLRDMDGICALRQVESLTLDSNMLHEDINPCLGKLQQLRYLNMKDNFLRGNIGPDLLGNLTQLETLHLGGNNLSGTFLLSGLANCSKLKSMVLSDNHRLEIETETATWTPLFQLEYLNLSNCVINKRSNGVVPSFLATQMSLPGIDMSRCSLRGKIPSWLVYNSNLSDFLLLHDNSLGYMETNGLLGSNMTSPLEVLDLSNNYLSMVVPSDFFSSPFPYLEYLDMSSNLLHGGIPSLAEATSLEVLDLSFNRLSGEIPPSLTGNESILTTLMLSHNDLTGPMPPLHWSLTELVHLSLENNRFSGRLSPLLSNSTSLKTLNVRNNHLSGNIHEGTLRFQNLGVILLGGNNFCGTIPFDLCFNNYLHFLDLSNNQFSGELPNCLFNDFWTDLPLYYDYEPFPGNVTQQRTSIDFTTKGENLTYMGKPLTLMTAIDFSMNQLSGTIPPPFGFLRQLKSLNLSHNHLVGRVPETFMYLQDMESLDLSHNKLNGSLPLQLANLTFLSFFSVAYNDLSGEIPFQSQLTTFNESSFEGNKGLCGEIINRNCSIIHEKQGGVLSFDDAGTTFLYWSFIAGSFSLGFWGAIAFLVWHAGFRRRHCDMVDKCMDKLGWSIVRSSGPRVCEMGIHTAN